MQCYEYPISNLCQVTATVHNSLLLVGPAGVSALQLAGSSEQVIVALKMISDKLRTVMAMGAAADRPPRMDMDSRDRVDRGDSKRIRGPERDGE